MSSILAQALAALVTMLAVRILNPDEDTKEVEKEIAEAPSADAVKSIAIREGMDALVGATDAETAELVEDLVTASTTGKVEDVVEKHKGNIFTWIVDAIFGIFKR